MLGLISDGKIDACTRILGQSALYVTRSLGIAGLHEIKVRGVHAMECRDEKRLRGSVRNSIMLR